MSVHPFTWQIAFAFNRLMTIDYGRYVLVLMGLLVGKSDRQDYSLVATSAIVAEGVGVS